MRVWPDGHRDLGSKVNEMPSGHLYWRIKVLNALINPIILKNAIFWILPV